MDRPWPILEAEVSLFVEPANNGIWWRVDFALNVVEGGGVVFLEFTSEGFVDSGSVTCLSFSEVR